MASTGSTAGPSGSYYVNLLTGTIQQQTNPLLAKVLEAAGYVGPFATIDAAKAAFNAAKGAAGLAPSGGLGAATGSGVSASSLFSSALGPLFQSNIWLRVGEVLVGVVLIAIGLNGMLKGKPFQVVTGTVGAAAKVVP